MFELVPTETQPNGQGRSRLAGIDKNSCLGRDNHTARIKNSGLGRDTKPGQVGWDWICENPALAGNPLSKL